MEAGPYRAQRYLGGIPIQTIDDRLKEKCADFNLLVFEEFYLTEAAILTIFVCVFEYSYCIESPY